MIAARVKAGGYVKAGERERVAQIAQEFGPWVRRQLREAQAIVRRRARQLEQRQRRALREQGQRLLERAGRVMAPRNDEGPLPRID